MSVNLSRQISLPKCPEDLWQVQVNKSLEFLFVGRHALLETGSEAGGTDGGSGRKKLHDS
jgi:hypothetical protein